MSSQPSPETEPIVQLLSEKFFTRLPKNCIDCPNARGHVAEIVRQAAKLTLVSDETVYNEEIISLIGASVGEEVTQYAGMLANRCIEGFDGRMCHQNSDFYVGI